MLGREGARMLGREGARTGMEGRDSFLHLFPFSLNNFKQETTNYVRIK